MAGPAVCAIPCARFGDRVFHDVDNIPDGEIFSEVIDRALQECDVALVIIGPNWATARDQHGRRLITKKIGCAPRPRWCSNAISG